VDSQLGRLFEHMREHGLYDNSIIVLTSDHGEAFYEHRQLGHWTMYDELLRVPLIIKTANTRELNERVSELVSLLDVAPTILDIVDARSLPMAEGVSLVGLLSDEHETGQEENFSGRKITSGSLDAHGHASLRYGDYKFIQHIFGKEDAAQELFNIREDPMETLDLSGTVEKVHTDYSSMLSAEIRIQREFRAIVETMLVGTEDNRVEFTDLMKDNLEALGYVE
jgi:arylsulfatase A-like enzyme